MNGRITAVAVVLLAVLCAVAENPPCARADARTAEKAISIWAVSDGEKIERDDLNSPLKRANSVWAASTPNGRRIKLFGARNEIIAFQLIVEAKERGIDSLSVSLRELARKGG